MSLKMLEVLGKINKINTNFTKHTQLIYLWGYKVRKLISEINSDNNFIQRLAGHLITMAKL